MSLLLWNDPFDFCTRPSRILGQHFGLDLEPEDFASPLIPRELSSFLHCPAGYVRPWRSLAAEADVGSTVKFDQEKFEADLDVQQFKPDEISVKVDNDRTVTIEGKHEEQKDKNGYVSRHFVRKYVLPRGCDVAKIESKLSTDGVLTVTAPRVKVPDDDNQRSISIEQTGKKSIDKDKGKEEKNKL